MKQYLLNCFVFLCFFVTFTAQAATNSTSHVQWGRGLPLESLKQAENDSLEKLVFQKALEFIAFELTPSRKEALQKTLKSQSRAFALSVKELETTPYSDGTNNSIFSISINEATLQQFLQELGILYTQNSQVSYSLVLPQEQSGMIAEELKKIADFELLTGLKRVENASIVLNLDYVDPLWTARLMGLGSGQGVEMAEFNAEGQSASQELHSEGQAVSQELHSEAPSLDIVWRSIWGKYFTEKQALSSQTAADFLLQVQGLRNPSAVEGIQRALRSWKGAVFQPALGNMDVRFGNIEASWRMKVLNLESLRSRLSNYADKHKLSFSLTNTVTNEVFASEEASGLPTENPLQTQDSQKSENAGQNTQTDSRTHDELVQDILNQQGKFEDEKQEETNIEEKPEKNLPKENLLTPEKEEEKPRPWYRPRSQ